MLVLFEVGSLFEKVHGKSIYEYMSANPASSRNFDDMMDKLSQKAMTKVLQKYEGFENLTSLVDVGGGSGLVMDMIIAKYPSIKGINYDLPHVLQNAPSYQGFKHVGGDMFQSIPKGDAILLKNILHNWSDERCLKILKNCHDALAEDGKVIAISYMIPEVSDSSTAAKLACHMDVMMFLFPGGKQRTQREFETLCNDAGFSDFKFCGYVHGIEVVMEFHK